ncbi:MAG: hypothetical protein JSW34_12220 [Candidatus Zixiibacteriota bacterium]|nr:MAG: hypothetical protein JSW34_12220 [candidate division Zixibacteria bacterium]
MMKRSLIFGLLSAVGAVLLSCGTGKVSEEAADRCQPDDLRVDVNTGSMDVSWKRNCDRLISGYNIYIAEAPASAVPFNSTPYSGDTNPDDGVEHFTAEPLDDGKKYYVSVRIVYPDRTLSRPSDELVAVCGPRGEIELSVRYKSDRDGYSFDQNAYVPANDLYNDIVFFSKDGRDYLDSPVRLDAFIKANRLRKTSLRGTFDQVKGRIDQLRDGRGEDRVNVAKGDWLHLRTPDDTNALIKVLDIYGSGVDRKIKLFFAYSPLPGEIIF